MNIQEIKEFIIDSNGYLYDILENLGCDGLHRTGRYLKATRPNGGTNNEALTVNIETLTVKCYSPEYQFSGDIISFVQDIKGYSIPQSIKYLCGICGVEYTNSFDKEDTNLPFGGFFNTVKVSNDNSRLKVYSESELDKYSKGLSYRFLKEGISLKTQLEFGIMYDEESHRILLPCYNEYGLIGIIGRYNADDYKKRNIPKYFPLIPYNKSQYLYGYVQNYTHMIDNVVLVAEAEKSVLLSHSYGTHNVVGVGNHSIQKDQCVMINMLYPKVVILAYDYDVNDEEYLKKECQNILDSSTGFQNYKIGYILDKQGKYLKDKESPFDIGKDGLQNLLKECVIYYN